MQPNDAVYSEPVSAPLAKRLAEAADGLRDGKIYFLVCKLKYPFDVKCDTGRDSVEEASAAANEIINQKAALGKVYHKFGPYRTPKEYDPPITFDRIELRFLEGEVEKHKEILKRSADAIILSLSAFDKFFLPYYTKLYGVEKAKDFRDRAKIIFSGEKLMSKGKITVDHSASTAVDSIEDDSESTEEK
jgi:hypothetical protein